MVLVDTDVFIWLSRGKKPAEKYRTVLKSRRVALSFATVAELYRGALQRGYNERSWQRLQADVDTTVVVPPTDELALEWGRVTNEARAAGHALGAPTQVHDAWIAATALLYDLPLLTDDGHFKVFPGLRLLK